MQLTSQLTRKHTHLMRIAIALIGLLMASSAYAQLGSDFRIEIALDTIHRSNGATLDDSISLAVDLTRAARSIGEFELVFSYPTDLLSFVGLSIDSSILNQTCSWDVLRPQVTQGEPSPYACPKSYVTIHGIADSDDYSTPDDSCLRPGRLFNLVFKVNESGLDCAFFPVRFAWLDCRSNYLLANGGAYQATERWPAHALVPAKRFPCGYPTGPIDGTDLFPTDIGRSTTCLEIAGDTGIDNLSLVNGGVVIECRELDERGDINLDGLSATLPDFFLLERSMLEGDTVLLQSGPDHPYQELINFYEADVNRDNRSETISDLVYLKRLTRGEEEWYIWPVPPPVDIRFEISTSGIINVDRPIGGAYIILAGRAQVDVLDDHAVWETQYREGSDRTYVVLFSEHADQPLRSRILWTDAEILRVELSPPNGGPARTLEGGVLPTEFALHQNYPNPFNPSTTIEFALPVRSDYELIIFNAQGQQVKSRQGSAEAGVTKIEWDGSTYASGVYLYKLEALGYEQTRKMLLLK